MGELLKQKEARRIKENYEKTGKFVEGVKGCFNEVSLECALLTGDASAGIIA